MFAFAVWIIAGGIVGWLASIATSTDAQQGVLINIIVGAVGAFLASLVMGGGKVMAPDYSLASMTATFAGAVASLAIVSLFQRRKLR